MWKKTTLAILTAAAMAGSAIQPVAAQGYYGGRYDDRYNDPSYNNQYNSQYDNRYGNPYDNRYDYDRGRYDREPDRYEPDRYRYDQRRTARFDRIAYLRECERQRSGNTAGGAIVGAIAGGVLGNAISRGPQRGPGTALGAILGGVAGASIGNNLNCEDRSYAIDTSYSGFEAGVPHRRYDWRGPRSGAYGYLQVGDYYQDRRGYRCATYSQQIFVRGRPEVARGYACRQPDGTWQLVG